ncbi:MAG: hypothetical protein ACKO3N_21555 [Verrucomicrobiota bacterium]
MSPSRAVPNEHRPPTRPAAPVPVTLQPREEVEGINRLIRHPSLKPAPEGLA